MPPKPAVKEPTFEYVVKNRLQQEDSSIHSWYRFVLGYPPHLVREYLEKFDADPVKDLVFEPFCGTATTPVEARLNGFSTFSIDANPISVLSARVKLSWGIDLTKVEALSHDIFELASVCLEKSGLEPSPEDAQLNLLTLDAKQRRSNVSNVLAEDFTLGMLSEAALAIIPKGFISEKPLLRVLSIRYAIDKLITKSDIREFFYLALANAIVSTAGNIGFGPEVYRRPAKEDADVLGSFFSMISRMVSDLKKVRSERNGSFPTAHVYHDDARSLQTLDRCPSIGIVITSPPYPNEKDYTRSTRLESVLLGLLNSKQDLRCIKTNLLRSNTRNVFAKDTEDSFINDIPSIVEVAEAIEEKRIELGKTSGFERLYHRAARLYFGGMYQHLAELYPRLKPGARLAYVVGDQMSYFRIHIKTAHLLADVAERIGYDIEGIDLWRTRFSTVTKMDLDENVLVLSRPNKKRNAKGQFGQK